MRHYLLVLSVAAAGCNPYNQRDGEFSAGSVDPANFPPGYVGVGGDHLRAGRGTFTEVRAFSNGQPLGYYSFPFSTTQLPPFSSGGGGTAPDPLRLVDAGKPYAKVPTPTAYLFDPATHCTPPAGYVYNARLDEVHYDQQGDIFTALPTATYSAGALPTWSYVPIVAARTVPAAGIGCQSIKSEATLKSSGAAIGMFQGTYLARAIIDVAAPVYRVGETAATSFGFGTQQLGWYNHYIVAYLDGGAIPTVGSADGSTVEMQPQTLYYPRSMVINGTKTLAGGFGFGYDVLDAKRGDAAYSPVCQLMTYDTGSAMTVDQLPKDVATIMSMYGSTLKNATVPFIFCLQVL